MQKEPGTYCFSYDKVDNRLSSVELKENSLDPTTPIQVPVAYVYNEDNQLTAMTKDGQPFASFTYDKNGNVLTKIVGTETTTYSWDSENRLTKIQTPTQTVEFAYDPFGRRLEKKTGTKVTRYVYDREDIVAEYDGSNVLQASYIHGPGVDEPLQMKRGGVTYFYQRDALGSIASLSDNTGNKLKTYRYDSFGNIISETGTVDNPYIYTGRERDSETGLYYYRARYYDPQLGRFLNEDPIGFGSGDTNFYAYVGNNPTSFIDPSGNNPFVIVAAGVIGGVLFSAPLEEVRSTLGEFGPALEGVLTGTSLFIGNTCAVNAERFLFGAKSVGILNRGRYLRIGVGRYGGRGVFRIAGDLVPKKLFPSGHIILKDLGPISKINKILGILPAAEMDAPGLTSDYPTTKR